uniref:Uncharacterized protein n=1 Tax=Megaviridae environmental sample TaxID=1737588 RepID=A0A5J6VJ03_9VIRU|nr:MAG: hypothetical protein [Megaviridae environmental sample]
MKSQIITGVSVVLVAILIHLHCKDNPDVEFPYHIPIVLGIIIYFLLHQDFEHTPTLKHRSVENISELTINKDIF